MTGSVGVGLPPADVPAPTALRARWPLGVWLSGAIALLLALPFRLPIPGFDTVNVLGQGIAVASAALLLPRLAMDAVQRSRGSSFRLLVVVLVVTGIVPWAIVAARRGIALGPLLSLVNWIALGGLVIAGQVLFARLPRLERAMRVWAATHAVIAGLVVLYLLAWFGSDVFLLEDRGPFQQAVQVLLAPWPNYFAIAMAVAVCVLYGRVLAGRTGPGVWVQLAALAAGLLVSFSRGGWLVCLAGLAVMTFIGGRLRRAAPAMLVLVALVVLAVAFVPGIRYQAQASFRPGTSQSVTLLRRVAFAVEAIRIWRRDPLVGIGFARFDEYATLSELAKISRAGAHNVEALGSVHNEYLSTLLKGGIIGLAGFLLLFFEATRRLRRLAADKADESGARQLAVTALGITTVLAIAGFGAESFRTLSTSALYWIVIGGLSALPPSPERHLP